MNIRHTTSAARSQSGMTLVELMIALLLGLLLMAGVIQIFLSNRAAYAFNEGLSRLQENGRFAMDTLSFHARMAGYLGCLSEVSVSNNLTNTNPLAFDFGQGLFGYEAVGTSPDDPFNPEVNTPAWSGGLPATLVGAVAPGSDVLIIRNASAESHALVPPFSDADKVYVNASSTEYSAGEIAIVSDCQKASVFQITGVSNEATGIGLSHTAGLYTPGNAAASESWDTDQMYAVGAEMRRAETWLYYVGTREDSTPALFQRRLSLNSAGNAVDFVEEELVEGVDTLQVLFGVDTDDDGAVDVYEPANAVADWNRVVSVRIGLLVRAPTEHGNEVDTRIYNVNEMWFDPPDDRRVREVFTTTIAIRNRLP